MMLYTFPNSVVQNSKQLHTLHFEKKAIRPKRKRKSVDNTAVLWYNGSITMKKERSQMRSDLIYIPDSELDALIQQDTPYLDLTTLGLDIGD